MGYKHIPVMLKEVLEYLDPKSGQEFIDCTLGGAGYTVEIAKRVGATGKVLAIDLDKLAIENAKKVFKKTRLRQGYGGQVKNVILIYGNFKNLQKIIKEEFKGERDKFDGIVFDLGLSSAQLEDKSRGFSFQLDAPLDMAFGQETGNRKQETEFIINNYKQEELTKILREYGEEKFARRIARKIVDYRNDKSIKTTGQLVYIIESAVQAIYNNNLRHSGARKIHFATRTFQALRIATNKELESIEIALPQAVDLLRKGGRIAVISYHSLEDRIVKRFFKKESKSCLCPPDIPICQCGHKTQIKILTKKIVLPSEEEIKINPRARSAKMRVAEKI